jgi:regulator of replication initiation timing/DNA-binding Xre family transcriptional regulator|nr:MAG TPA: helix-turn-helix domain protein [Caudoviricetes sp.]
MYYFNSFLFNNLPKLFGLSDKGVSEKVYGKSYMYKRKVDNQDNILVQDIVMVCNTFHISLSNFIMSAPPENLLGNRFKYVIPDEDFKEVRFIPENLRWLYGQQGLTKIPSLAEFSRQSGISVTSIVRWQNPKIGGCTVNWLIGICNRFGIDIDVFMEDENEKLEKYAATETEISPRVWQEISELKEAIREYRQERISLLDENRKLKARIKETELVAEEATEYTYADRKVREWKANWRLLENFHIVVGVARRKVIQDAGMQNFSELFIEGNMLITSLVKLCNKYHISTRHIFYRDNGIVPEVNVYDYYRSDNWKTVVFHPEYVNDFFGKESVTGINRSELLERMNISEWKLRAWRKENSTMRIKDMLEICNRLEVTPYYLISDQNRMDISFGVTSAEILLEENRMLRQQVIRLKEKLQKKNGEGFLPLDE